MNKNRKVFMWYKVKELWDQGLNKSQISRELGIDRGTVRKYIQIDEAAFLSRIMQPRCLPKKLSGYYKFVKKLLESTPYLSSAQVEDRLKENYKNLPTVDSKTVYNFVRSIRQENDIVKYKHQRQYQKLPEVDYGSEAQVDFGECYMQQTAGKRIKVYFFTMVLSRSRYKYVYLQCKPFTTEMANYAHDLSFAYFGGIPRKIVYDQDSVFIKDENLGDVLLTKGFAEYTKQYPFEAVFCRKADPESKGKVENVVKYVKHNFLKGRVFTNIEILQQECLSWLERTGNAKTHSTTRKIPKEQWEIERQHLLTYNATPQKPLLQLPEYKVRKDNTIAYRGNFYSLPIGTYEGIESTILLEDNGENLLLYDHEKTLITSHKIPSGKGIYVRNTDHKRTKSKTIRQAHETLLIKMGDTPEATQYLDLLEKDKSRYYYDNIRVITASLSNVSQQSIEKALAFCLGNKVFNGYRFVDVLNYYKKEEMDCLEDTAQIPVVDNDQSYHDMLPEKSNIELYENIV